MSNPNPLVPQGSLLEQQARSKSTFQMAAFIVALHVVVLGGFLFLGCKKEENQAHTPTDTFGTPPPVVSETPTNTVAAVDPSQGSTNTAPAVLPVANTYVPPVTPAPVEPATSTPTSPAVGGTEHVVQKGDLGYVIAKKNGVTLKQLQEANPGKDLAKLKVGDKIVIPASASTQSTPAAATHSAPVAKEASGGTTASGTTYTVKGGDNLSKIAKKYGVTVKAIRDANGMTSNEIKVGHKLKIPTKAHTAAADSSAPSSPAAAAAAPTAVPTAAPVVTPLNPVSTSAPGTTPAPR